MIEKDSDNVIDFKRYTLSLEKFQNQFRFSPEVARQMREVNYMDHLRNESIFSLLCYVYSDKYSEDKTIVAPKNWWQHFKYDCFPEWLKRYFPVKFIEHKVSLEHMRLYPDIPLQGRKYVHEIIEIDTIK